MDTLDSYREAVELILSEYAAIPYANGELTSEVVFDRKRDRYLLVDMGWDRGIRIHDTLIHVDMIDGKLWIQHDGTESGIATELVQRGVPKDRIVLGFRPKAVRPYTDFAAA